jgi:dTDP-4-amino-4,6-dideoxygalactose transaminase
MEIPFHRTYLTGKELEYIRDVLTSLDSGGQLSGDGPYTKKVQQFLETRFGAEKALLTPSCTAALELATHLIQLKPGDEVIIPSFTFTSTANPIIIAGGRLVFAEIDEETLNISPEDIRKKITPRTRAIYPVHYGGVACPMDEIMEIAEEHDLAVVEDAAQGINARWKKKYLGTIGHFGCYSFHESKNISCGEGGALLINTDDPSVFERALVIREKGTNRNRFFRGLVDKYTWMDIGSSYLPSELQAAFLLGQLENLDEIQYKRMKVFQYYAEKLNSFAREGRIRIPCISDDAAHNAHIFYIILQNVATRNQVMEQMKRKGISLQFHYVPLHTSPMGRSLGYATGDLPITEQVSACLLRLPIYSSMAIDEANMVVTALQDILKDLS